MKNKRTKTDTFELTAARQAEIEALAGLADDEIDTSDIPEVRDWSGAKRGLFYLPLSSNSLSESMPI